MTKNQNKLQLTITGIFTLLALVILVDLALPGKFEMNEIVSINKSREEYNNAAGNFHYSYQIETSKHTFPVEEAFTNLVKPQDFVAYSVSRIFQEVNWYKVPRIGDEHTYSLRIVSGLVLPLLALSVFFIRYRFNKNMSTLVFVLQVLLIADLVFLLM
ncbi:hypothetical protein [Roseivirga misakiensis]|uniref:Uncharacterized protein n=1 Tax=Roseivirga misakiensis TaxID=1563681 RepID=A0A1E5SZ01_9BACT|nr:hypothetical protein [Roseivirga misakiensis]OEK04358.1 hypothetical protein BFP71_12815 [Roseivirga misakiensis]